MIIIPPKFEKILNSDTSIYQTLVSSAIQKFESILSANNLYFFEEYTDHGVNHINNVMNAAADLITEDTLAFLSKEDVAILIVSILLHDLGMHLQPLTFLEMVRGGYDDIRNEELDKKKWGDLWNQYINDAKKMNSSQRRKIFGNGDVVIGIPQIEKVDNLTGTDRKLIGEFIRLHHPRIAHELAIKGFFSNRSEFERLIIPNLPLHIVDLIGLLARSHGMNIRDTFPYLKKKLNKVFKRPYGTHLIFLMIVLRLSDYFQIDARRVSYTYYLSKFFNSEISFEEHQKHLQVIYLQELDSDPETYFATAQPINSKYYLALKKLFEDIQAELDLCWAIHGEVYGLIRNSVPKIKIRRFQSNILASDYAKQLPFIPEAISFSLDREVALLLAAPLYAGDLSCAVRELIQNAVDACREREFYEKNRKNKYEPQIEITIEKGGDSFVLTIRDNGKGMGLFEIKNYFLRIGASYRNSSQWRTEFLDKDGKNVIPRIGKFGIGILASFLLSDEIHVQTMSMFEGTGYEFKTRNTDDQIEVSHFKGSKPGTIIKIPLSDLARKQLLSRGEHIRMFDQWYYLATPAISYKTNDRDYIRSQIEHIPSPVSKNSKDWFHTNSKNYKDLFYSISYASRHGKMFFCNGIVIPNQAKDAFKPDIVLKRQLAISVFDPEGVVPLSIDRNTLVGEAFVEKAIKEDIFKNIIAKLLALDFEFNLTNITWPVGIKNFDHIALINDDKSSWDEDMTNFIFSANGFTLNHSCFRKSLKNYKLYYVVLSNRQPNNQNSFIKNPGINSLLCIIKATGSELQEFIDLSDGNNEFAMMYNKAFYYLKLPDKFKTFRKDIDLKSIEIYHKDEPQSFVEYFLDPLNDKMDFCFISNPRSKDFPDNDFYHDIIKKYLGDDPLIPYNKSDRKRKFPFAYDKLAAMITTYERPSRKLKMSSTNATN